MHFSLILSALLSLVPVRAQLTKAPYDPSQFSIIGDIDRYAIRIVVKYIVDY